MNAQEKAKILKQAGYIHTYSMKSDGVFYRWFAPDGTEFKAERRYLATDLAYQHYLAPAQEAPAPVIEPIDAMGDGGFVWHDRLPQQAPAPVDSLAAKNERIAELEAENARISSLWKYMTALVDEAQATIATQGFNDHVHQLLIRAMDEAQYAPKAPQAAPVQEAVTLSDSEIEWLAKRWVDTNEFRVEDGESLKTIEDKLYVFFKRVDGVKHVELCCDYDTEANFKAIAAKRAKLDAPKPKFAVGDLVFYYGDVMVIQSSDLINGVYTYELQRLDNGDILGAMIAESELDPA